jgi:hypothetical protein
MVEPRDLWGCVTSSAGAEKGSAQRGEEHADEVKKSIERKLSRVYLSQLSRDVRYWLKIFFTLSMTSGG